MNAQWEIVLDDHKESVRRLAVPTGWVYQTQTGRGYRTVEGTVGRERDTGTPIWGPIVFVPNTRV